MGIHFAETTGQRFKPSWLKVSKGKEGYSENLSEILPKWSSEYVKFKNTEAFIKDFTTKFGVKVNIRNVKFVEGGLKVGDNLYPNHRIVAPDGYLRFYRGKIDFQREVSKRMGNMTFDEAIGEVLNETVTESVSAAKGGAKLSKAGEMIEQRVKDALKARGFATGEVDQMLARIKTGEAPETITEIVKERVITKSTGASTEDILKLFQGMQREYVGVAKNQTVYLVPKEAVKELETFATPFMGSQKLQNIVRLVVDKPTQVWKDSVLAGSPRWVKNNVVGDFMSNTVEGVGPLSYSRAFRDLYRDIIPDKLLEASFANIMKYNPKLGKTAETTFGQLITELEATKVVRNIAKVKDAGYAVNTAAEQLFVRAHYIAKARPLAKEMLKAEGLPQTEVNMMNKLRLIKADPKLSGPIIDKIKTKLPVFNLTGSQERKYVKRFLPFYNWYKFMTLYAAKLPAEHPFLTVGGRGLGALAENQREDAFMLYFPFMAREIEENGIPQRLDNLWPIGEIGEEKKAMFFNTRGLNPFATIEDIVNLDVLPMLSPVFTVPMEQITGKAVFGDREFRSGEEGIYKTAEGEVKFQDFAKVRPPLWDHILGQLPQYEMAKKLLVPAKQFDTGTIFNPDPIMDPVTGEYKYPIDSVEKILNFMGIDKKTLDIREVWEAYLKRKSIAFGRATSKGISKDNVSFEDIREIIKSLDKGTLKQIRKELELKQEEKAGETKELLRLLQEEEKARKQGEEEGKEKTGFLERVSGLFSPNPVFASEIPSTKIDADIRKVIETGKYNYDDKLGINKCNLFVSDMAKKYWGVEVPKRAFFRSDKFKRVASRGYTYEPVKGFPDKPVGASVQETFFAEASLLLNTGVEKVTPLEGSKLAAKDDLVLVLGMVHMTLAAPHQQWPLVYRSDIAFRGKDKRTVVGLKKGHSLDFYLIRPEQYNNFMKNLKKEGFVGDDICLPWTEKGKELRKEWRKKAGGEK